MARNLIRRTEGTSPILQRYARMLDSLVQDYYLGDRELIPLEDLPAVRRAVEATMVPAPPSVVAKQAVNLVGSIPRFGHLNPYPEVYFAALQEELGPYPPDVLHEMVRVARRTYDAQPSVHELLAIVDRLMEPRRKQLQAVERVEAEYADRKRQAETAERRAREEAAEIVRVEAIVAGAPENRPEPGEFTLAREFLHDRRPGFELVERFRLARDWQQAIGHLEPWALLLCRRAALVAMIERRTIPVADVLAALSDAEQDIAATISRIASLPPDREPSLPVELCGPIRAFLGIAAITSV